MCGPSQAQQFHLRTLEKCTSRAPPQTCWSRGCGLGAWASGVQGHLQVILKCAEVWELLYTHSPARWSWFSLSAGFIWGHLESLGLYPGCRILIKTIQKTTFVQPCQIHKTPSCPFRQKAVCSEAPWVGPELDWLGKEPWGLGQLSKLCKLQLPPLKRWG